MQLAPGSSVGAYQLERVLGEGPLATTWLATRPPRPERYAIKVLWVTDKTFQERVRRAGQVQGRMRHENLVPVLEIIEAGPATGLVMQHVEGTHLGARLEGGALPVADALALFRGVLAGVEHAHGHGLIHRNLKPGKILLAKADGGWVPRINDFALVKLLDADGKPLTQMGTSFGTPQYMAPEQFRDVSAVDARADVFALGAILYEMVCGRRAFDGSDVVDIYKQVSEAAYTPPAELCPDLPDAVVQAIERSLAPDAEQRPASCAELRALLYPGAPASEERPSEAPTVVPPREATGPVERVNPATASVLLLAAFVAALLVISGALVVLAVAQ